MKKMQNYMIGVDHGDVVMFSDFENDGIMWKGEGARQTDKSVDFSASFRGLPVVQVSMSMFDVSNNANIRVDVQAEEITEDGFLIVFRTWGDTKIARVRVAWQAIGEVHNDDDWKLP